MQELGRWVDASERYLDVTRLQVPDRGSEVHQKAQADAAEARAALLPRIPRLRISLRGAEAASVSISIDGAPLGPGAVGLPLPLNPGEHRVVAKRGSERVEKTTVLEEGKESRVELSFKPEPAKPPTPPKPITRRVVAPKPDPEPSDGPDGLRVGGFVALGIGGAALVAGIVTGVVLLVENDKLSDECVEGECSFGSQGNVDTYNALRPTTTVTLAVGAAGVGTGLILLFAIP
jgi:hypothetical protein